MIKKIIFKKAVLAILTAVSFLGAFGFKKDFSFVKAMESRNISEKEDCEEKDIQLSDEDDEKNKNAEELAKHSIVKSIHSKAAQLRAKYGHDKTLDVIYKLQSKEIFGKKISTREEALNILESMINKVGNQLEKEKNKEDLKDEYYENVINEK